MALQTYPELAKFVASTLGRDDLSEEISDWIYIAELEAQRELDLEMVEKRETGTTTAGRDWIALPKDYVELRWLEIQTDPIRSIRMASPADHHDVKKANIINSPIVGYVSQGRLYMARVDSAVAYELVYYAGIPHLGPENQTNYLIRVGADYLAYTACLHSAPFIGADSRVPLWERFQSRAEASMRRQAARARLGGGPLYMRSDSGHP